MLAIDCNTLFGVQPDQRTNYGPHVLATLLEKAGVTAALTISRRGLHFHHQYGNEETLRVCELYPQFIPAATINLARYVDWEKDVDWCLARPFRAWRLWPEEQRWSVRDLSFRLLCEKLAPTRMPLIFTIQNEEKVNDIAERTAEYGLPVVLTLGSYSNEANTIHLARRFPHIHLDVARRATPHIVRYLVGEIGLDRVVFGSNAPMFGVQPAMNAVYVAGLPDEQTGQIMSGNLLRLLRLTPADVRARHNGRVAEEPRWRGYPGPTIDVHAHLGAWRFPILTHTTDTMLAYARDYNLEKIIISSALGIVYDMADGNRELKQWIDPHPTLLGYVVTNPNLVPESAAEMDKYYKFPNFVGAKIHADYSKTNTSAPRMAALFGEIAKRGKPVKIHNLGADWMQGLQALARRYRELTIVIAHGGGWGAGPFFKDDPNVYYEFCGSSSTPGLLQECLGAVGEDRIMFGTDQDLFDPSYEFGEYHDAGFTPAQEKKIFYTNAKRVYGLP